MRPSTHFNPKPTERQVSWRFWCQRTSSTPPFELLTFPIRNGRANSLTVRPLGLENVIRISCLELFTVRWGRISLGHMLFNAYVSVTPLTTWTTTLGLYNESIPCHSMIQHECERDQIPAVIAPIAPQVQQRQTIPHISTTC